MKINEGCIFMATPYICAPPSATNINIYLFISGYSFKTKKWKGFRMYDILGLGSWWLRDLQADDDSEEHWTAAAGSGASSAEVIVHWLVSLNKKTSACTVAQYDDDPHSSLSIFYKHTYTRRKIRLIESNAKCRHLKKFTCKRTLRQVFLHWPTYIDI